VQRLKVILATKLDSAIAYLVKTIVQGLGITTSEYLRMLILQDLDKRGLTNEHVAATVLSKETDSG